MREIVRGAHAAHRVAQLARGVALLPSDASGAPGRLLEARAVGDRFVRLVGSIVPGDRERLTSLYGGPCASRDYGDPASRQHPGWRRCVIEADDPLDAGHALSGRGVERCDRPSIDWGPGDHGELHPGHVLIDPVARASRRHVHEIDARDLLAEETKLRRGLEVQRLAWGHGQRAGDRHERRVIQGAAGRRVRDLMISRADFSHGHAPLLGGGGLQHRTASGPRLRASARGNP